MLDPSETLRTLVNRKFISARNNNDLLFSQSHLATLRTTIGSGFQLRYCPALKSKPTTDSKPKEETKPPGKKFDPFENPSPELLIGSIPRANPTHNLVLNKYPVIQNHFILATKGNKPQSGLLEEDDLFLTYSCLQSWGNDGGQGNHSLFAFFNSGEHSGASQPHRHLQLLPVEDMGSTSSDGWDLLCNSMMTPCHDTLPLLQNPRLPFVHYGIRLQAQSDARGLYDRYILLMRAALTSITGDADLSNLDAVSIDQDGETTFSYNLAMTTEMMAILPRKQDAAYMANSNDGYVFVNGTILAGTLMVRDEDDWKLLRQDPELVLSVLNKITYPRTRHAHDARLNL